eukprot:4750561-Pyramimonas_sp.AAC.1
MRDGDVEHFELRPERVAEALQRKLGAVVRAEAGVRQRARLGCGPIAGQRSDPEAGADQSRVTAPILRPVLQLSDVALSG